MSFSLASDDPYESFLAQESFKQNLIANDRTSKFSRKYKHFKLQMQQLKGNLFNGALAGFAIGAMAGFAIGILTAITTRRLIFIPITMLSTGVFFAGVMSLGSVIRAHDHILILPRDPHGEVF